MTTAQFHIRWPSIEQYRHLIEAIKYRTQCIGKDAEGEAILDSSIQLPKLKYKGTVKLHGENLSIAYADNFETQWLQTRETIVDTNSGTYNWYLGFKDALTDVARKLANSVEGKKIHAAAKEVSEDEPTFVVFGEYCGKGIQKKCAIHQLEKFYSIFAIGYTYIDKNIADANNNRIYKWISDDLVVPAIKSLNSLRVFHVDQFSVFTETFDFSQPEAVLLAMQAITATIEKQCPAGTFFGVTGIGEGVVWRCQEEDEGYDHSRYWVKIKGDEHKVSKFKERIELDPEEARDIGVFVEHTVTLPRLEQGISHLTELKLRATEDNTGTFLQWIVEDIVKEEKDRIEASGLDIKKLRKALGQNARTWYLKNAKTIGY